MDDIVILLMFFYNHGNDDIDILFIILDIRTLSFIFWALYTLIAYFYKRKNNKKESHRIYRKFIKNKPK
jgi:hypothetical protein